MTIKDSPDKPSDMFINSLSEYGVGSDDIECGWCGRHHLCVDTEFAEDPEEWADYCNSEFEKDPEHVVLHRDCDSVSAVEMNGHMFVICCPCNGLQRYEHFIWEHRQTIRNYLKVRTDQEYEWAEQEKTLNRLAGI